MALLPSPAQVSLDFVDASRLLFDYMKKHLVHPESARHIAHSGFVSFEPFDLFKDLSAYFPSEPISNRSKAFVPSKSRLRS